MAKHRAWFRVVTAGGEKSEPMSRAAAELVVARTGGKVVACLPPTLPEKKEQLALFGATDKAKGLH